MCGLVTFMVDTAAALAKYITEQERGVKAETSPPALDSCLSCGYFLSIV